MSTEITTIQEPSVGMMLGSALTAIQSGEVTPAHVDVLKGLMELHERHQAREDKRAFAAALAALQGETIRVVATKKVEPKPDGTCRYKFAPYEEIMAQVQPILSRHGFSITFDTEVGDQRLTCICTLTHSSGEARQNRFAVRYGKPPGSSDAQGDMSTKSYAKRGALCDALNIVIDHDDDARTVGRPISAEKAAELERRCAALRANPAEFNQRAFLDYAGAKTFEEIGDAKLAEIELMLSRKEAKAKSAKPAPSDNDGMAEQQDIDWNAESDAK